MKSHHTPMVERVESRQFLSAVQEQPEGPFAGASGAAGAETDEVESAGHRLDFLAPVKRASGDGPPHPDGQSSSFSLDQALREMAAAFEQTHGRARGDANQPPFRSAGGSSPEFEE